MTTIAHQLRLRIKAAVPTLAGHCVLLFSVGIPALTLVNLLSDPSSSWWSALGRATLGCYALGLLGAVFTLGELAFDAIRGRLLVPTSLRALRVTFSVVGAKRLVWSHGALLVCTAEGTLELRRGRRPPRVLGRLTDLTLTDRTEVPRERLLSLPAPIPQVYQVEGPGGAVLLEGHGLGTFLRESRA